MSKFFDKWLGRASGAVTLWPLISSGIVGVVAGYLARGTHAVAAYGAFGWLMAGLIAFVLTALGFWLAALVFDRISMAIAKRKWSHNVQSINPLEDEFRRQRINILDLVASYDQRVRNKRFFDCELVGRTAILLSGCHLQNVGFIDCDTVIWRDDIDAPICNSVLFENCMFVGGKIIRCVIFMTPQMFESGMRQLGVIPVTFEGPASPSQSS